ncbi:MAG: TonB family protein [Candidatus Aminicenantes bacterium]
MRMHEGVSIKLLVAGLMVLWLCGVLIAGGDILVNFRFYEGLRGNDIPKTSVVTSYYLRPLFVGNIVSDIGIDQEKEELKRIFNLKNLNLMTQTHWGWKVNQKEKRFQVIILNGHEFIVKLVLRKVQNSFKLEVIEKDKTIKDKALLDTNIILPEEKTTVFGFEDSMNKSYFLSLHREKNEAVIREDMVTIGPEDRPKLVKRISPLYPKTAREKNIEGTVILNLTVDTNGKVKKLGVVRGDPLLRKAAIDAVAQWEYEPYLVKGRAREVIFTVSVTFSLPGDKSKDRKKELAGELPDIPSIWPTRGHLTSMFGMRIHPFTGEKNFHNGIDIAAVKGTPVKAAANGEVIAAEYKDIEGNYVIINHKNGYTTYYGRLQSFTVKKGDLVKRFDVIGYVGNTGRSTAPHLHYEIRLNNKPVDPMTLIEPMKLIVD